jgi:hypothetical protein
MVAFYLIIQRLFQIASYQVTPLSKAVEAAEHSLLSRASYATGAPA